MTSDDIRQTSDITSSVVSNLDPADGVRAPDPVVVSHHQLEADTLQSAESQKYKEWEEVKMKRNADVR